MAENDKKKEALDNALAKVEKTYGKGAAMRLGDNSNIDPKVTNLSTGIPSLDIALGIGGLPRGRIAEVFGPESSGKTTLCLNIIAEIQRMEGSAVFIDAENCLDINYAKSLGIDVDDLIVSQPSCGEEGLEIAETFIRSGGADVIVVDSLAALVPRAELDGEMGDIHVGLQARLLSQAMRKLSGIISKSNTIVLFINQLREKAGVHFGNPETTPGGRAVKFYSSVRLDIRRKESIKKADEIIGNRVKVKVVKNKVAPPFKEVMFDIIFGQGVSYEGDLLDLAVKGDIIKKSGAWYSYNDENLGHGREATKNVLLENPQLVKEIKEKVFSFHFPKVNEEQLNENEKQTEKQSNKKEKKESSSKKQVEK